MEEIAEILVMTLVEMLYFLVLIIVHDYMFVMTKITLLGLRPTFVIKGSFGSPEKKNWH